MLNRKKKTFEDLKKKKKKALGIFLTAGDPDLETSLNIIKKLPNIGADFIEIGMPFSDPMADGPSIQESSERALKKGMTLKKCLLLVKKFRVNNQYTPIILMGYYNPIHTFGKERFVKEALESGVDGLIIVDLPPEEDKELYNYAEERQLSLIRLVTPTTDGDRLKYILSKATGFVYYVSITGITGTKKAITREVQDKINIIKKHTSLPIVVGFGIKTPEQALEMSLCSEGIVVGSAIVDKIKHTLDENNNPNEKTEVFCLNFISEISKKVNNN